MLRKLPKFLVASCFILMILITLISTCVEAYSGNPLLLNSDVNLTNSFERGFYCMNHGMHYHQKKFYVYEQGWVDSLEKELGIMGSEGMLLSFVLGEANRAADLDVKFEGKGSQEETIDGNNLRTYEPWQNYIWHVFGQSGKYTQLTQPIASTYQGLEEKFNEYIKIWRQVIANGENPLNIIPVSSTGKDLLTYVDPSNPNGTVLKTDDVLIADESGRVKVKVEYPWANLLNEYYGNIFKDGTNVPGLLNLVEIKILINGVAFYDSTYNTNVVNKLQNVTGGAFKIGDKEAYIDISELNYGEEANIKVEWNFNYYEKAQYSKLTPYRSLKATYICPIDSKHIYEKEISTYKINNQWQNIPTRITVPHSYNKQSCIGNIMYLDTNSIEYNVQPGEKGGEYQDILYMKGDMNTKKLEKEINVFIGQPNIKIKLNKIDSLILNNLSGVGFEISVENGNILTANGWLENPITLTTTDKASEIEIKPDNTKGFINEMTVIFKEINLSYPGDYLMYKDTLEVTFIWDSSSLDWKVKEIKVPKYDNGVEDKAEITEIEENSWILTAENRPKVEELSGYVWIDGITGEKKIEPPNGKYDSTESPKAGVKVYLFKTDGTQVEYDGYGVRFGPGGEGYLITGNDGRYEFRDLPKLPAGEAYYIMFEYDGINYIRTILGAESKADEADRVGYNARFKTISPGQSNDGTKLEYTYDGTAVSTLITENGDGTVLGKFAITADTQTAGNTYNETTRDINLGISKKVVDLALMTDLYKATATINGVTKTLQYNTKFDDDMNSIIDVMQNKTADSVEYNINLYRSDYNYRIGNYINGPSLAHQPTLSGEEQGALQESREELEVILEYVVILANQSTTNASVEEFEFYFDSHLNPVDVTGGTATRSGNKLVITPDSPSVSNGSHTEVRIKFKAINLSEEQTIKNYAEITRYSTIEGGFVDCDSAPGNSNAGSGTFQYEDDSDEARGVKLRVSRTDREISGNVFEDNKVNLGDNHNYITGNGKYDDGENKIDDVIVQLIEIKNLQIGANIHRLEYIWQETTTGTNTVRKISDDGTIIQTVQYTDVTPETGKYVFRGFIPGDYIVRFIYGDGTYFDTAINSSNILKYNGQDYKSTMDEKYDKGFLVDSSYSSKNSSMARDNEARRLEVMAYALGITDGNDLIINSKEKLENTWMAAETSKIIVEDTMIDGVSTFYRKANFGLVERPATKLALKKHIGYVELKDVTGSTIVQAGVDAKSQYIDDSTEIVDFRNGIAVENAPIEATATTRQNRGYWQVESNNVDGATLKMTYKYIVTNVGEPDYLSQSLSNKFSFTGAYDVDLATYIDEVRKCASEVKSAMKTNKYDIQNSYLGNAYYSGTKGTSDVNVKTYVNLEDYLGDLSFESSPQFEIVANSENKKIISKTGSEDTEDVKVIRTKNGEALTANNAVEFDVTVKTTIADKTSFPSYIAQIITPITSLSGTKTTGSTPNNLEYVQSYYGVARLDDLGLGKGAEIDEFWAETFRIVPTTGADKQTPTMLMVTITAGITVIAVGVVLVKKFMVK